jgi:hypothetical protein
MRNKLILLLMLFGLVAPAAAQVSIGIGLPNVSIGINLQTYPQLVPVPGYPVYYAPQLRSNYFFYDGMYWVYQDDRWYASAWYNGPWGIVAPEVVPVYVLRVPVRYYRRPPAYFHGWKPDAPPRWGQHWGNDWEQHRSGWEAGCAPTLGPALGQRLGTASERMGPLGPAFGAGPRAAACLSAQVLRRSVSTPGAAAGVAGPELPVPAAGPCRARALRRETSAKRPGAADGTGEHAAAARDASTGIRSAGQRGAAGLTARARARSEEA